jgi:mono/diheme cytochrome c family protein
MRGVRRGRTGSIKCAAAATAWIAACCGSAPTRAAEPAIEYNQQIRPILAENCFACHGPDARKREAGLRLDRSEGARAKLESGATAIVPGDPTASELVRRIESSDDDQKMPPPDSIKRLTAEQIKLLKAWVAAGGEYQGHWSLLPIDKPAPPAPAESSLAGAAGKNPIDRFVEAGIGRHRLAAAPEADPVTLARRLAFDLTGLPPTPEQVAHLAGGPSDAAYEQLVDELLASPRYGERLAMWWLDLVRYADSVGYHGDQPVSVYPFREYVIRAFNDNKRFDQFTVEQLAGDLLPDATLENKIASGYNRLGMMSEEGGVQPKEYLAKYIAERVRNASGTWLGLTLGCAECHDHKFDPLTSKDFYRFEAFFADIQEKGLYGGDDFSPALQVPTAAQVAELARLTAENAALAEQLSQSTPELEAAQLEWEQSLKNRAVDWVVLRPTSAESKAGATLTTLDDGSILASGKSSAAETYTIAADTPLAAITAIRLEVLADPSLPAQGPGRAGNGNFVLSECRLTAAPASDPLGEAKPVALAGATADHSQGGQAVAAAVDNNPATGWAILPEAGKNHVAIFEAKDSLGAAGGTRLTFTLEQLYGSDHAIGRLRLAATSAARPVQVGSGVPPAIDALLLIEPGQRTDEQRRTLAAHYRSLAPQIEPLRQKMAEAKKSLENLNRSIPTTLVTVAVPPRPVRVLARGNWMDESGEEVQPGVPAALPQPAAKEGRLTRHDLARWIVAADNPLTARVLVNRLWKLYFGAGLSRKLDDLGAQGEWPSHPQLLDWLAVDLVASGWDLKHTIKSIVMSQSYRRSSLVSPEAHEKDPYNLWLARQSRFRLDAEMVRDNALWISGLLVERIGGPSVKPYQPPRYWAYLNFPEREWQNATGDDLYRRGLYTHWQRQYLHPSLLAFDGPSREECTADRPRSNTPLQSLVLLNDPTYVEAARVFAELILRQGGSSPAERLDFAMRRALERPIRPTEAETLGQLLASQQEFYKQNPTAAGELLSVGARPPGSGLDPAELAAWTNVARTILNLHAVITRN